MNITIQIKEEEMKEILVSHLLEKFTNGLKVEDIKIYVKSKQNYKSEWEEASFKAEYNGAV